jgi:hypothetical protein
MQVHEIRRQSKNGGSSSRAGDSEKIASMLPILRLPAESGTRLLLNAVLF